MCQKCESPAPQAPNLWAIILLLICFATFVFWVGLLLYAVLNLEPTGPVGSVKWISI